MLIQKNNYYYNELLSNHTSWKVGGPAEIFFTPENRSELSKFLESNDKDITWIGNGTNVLVRDGGVRGVVISTKKSLAKIELVEESICRVDAGTSCFELAMFATKNGFGPAAFFSGIPGSIGGALTMNAGCFGHETWEFVTKIEAIDERGQIHHLNSNVFSFSYRSVTFPFPLWFLSCEMTFPKQEVTTIEELKKLRDSRVEHQPLNENTCGSVFKNPKGHHAGDLIERSNLKGYRVGGCAVSEKHANFIVNDKEATAKDIETLIRHIQDSVKDCFGVDLETEVRIIGEHD